jgi:hypothetical protein
MENESLTCRSGEICSKNGLYWASGCGHADVKIYTEGDVFPACEFCNAPINWILQRPRSKSDSKK